MAIVFNFLFLLQTITFTSVCRCFMPVCAISKQIILFRTVCKKYLSGVKTFHNILDLEYPVTNLYQLNSLIRGLAHIKQHVPNKALPITPEILKDFHRCLNPENTLDIVFWCLFLLMFFFSHDKKIQYGPYYC